MPYEILEYFEPDQELQVPKEESTPEYLLRQGSRLSSRALESIGSIPHVSYDILKMISNAVPEQVKTGLKQAVPGIGLISGLTSLVGENAPSQESIRKTIGQLAPEGYLEPQTEREKVADEIASDVASLMIPLGPLKAVKPLKALGIAGASNIASYLSKNLGASEKTQTGVKLGTMLLTSLGMGPSLKNKAEQLYKVAEESIIPGEKIPATSIRDTLKKITKDYTTKGLSKSAGKVDVERVLDEVNSFIHDDKIGLHDLWSIKKDMNDAIAKVGFNTKGGIELKILEEEMKSALKNSPNKAFSSALSAADEIYGGVQRAKNINDFVKGLVNNKVFGGTALYTLLHDPANAIPNMMKVAGGGAAILGGIHSKEIISNILKNPSIRNEYMAMINAAVKENSRLVIRHAKKLNKVLEQQEAKPRKRYEILEEF